ncbi:MAG: CrcB family protein [Lactobacillus sp.]|jgi:CrcB protein|nr:CrcB family protein [Lactobacillus sp.]
MTTLLIGFMALFGGAARLGLSNLIPAVHGFPWATFVINLAGAFILPLWTQWLGAQLHLSERWILAGGTGFCGAFTTFSTFSVETMRLVVAGRYGLAFTYAGLSAVFGLALALASVTLAQHLLKQRGEQRLVTDEEDRNEMKS